MTKIELHPKGKHADIISNEIIDALKAENNLVVEKVKYLNFGVLETLLITIAGGVSANLINKLLEKVLFKKENKINEITIYHIDKDKEFTLPEEKSEYIEFIELNNSNNSNG